MSSGPMSVENAYELGRIEGERAATQRIVQWLRDSVPMPYMKEEIVHPYLCELADAIERGEHKTSRHQ